MHSIRRTQTSTRRQQAERNAFYTFAKCSPVQVLGRVLYFIALCKMKHGKYDLSSADLSVGTSYSWYYRKNNNSTTKSKQLPRAASDSTLFSDYTNQINLFEKERLSKNKKAKKTISDVGKNNRVKCRQRNIKPVHMEPFTGNFFYGKPLPGYDNVKKNEEKIAYLPDSDIITVSEDNTAESITTAPTIVDLPELVKNPLYGCRETDVHILTPEYSSYSSITKDSQLLSNSCTELRKTMNSGTNSQDILTTILNDYKRIMKEWNNTIKDHYSTISHSKNNSSICGKSNADSYVHSLHSTLPSRQLSKFPRYCNYKHYKYPYLTKNYKKYQNSDQRKRKSLPRNTTTNNWTSTLQYLKRKFQKDLTPSECECLEAIYEDYDKRLKEWCDTISHYSTITNSGYKEEIEKPENQHALPAALVGQTEVLFGNLHELFTFHQEIFLKDLERSISATELVALCFVEKRETFFRLYSYYCQNIPRSERLRETLVDTHLFLQACQQRLGHKLPLAAYLLKPVQRITKYQLLLKDLLRYSECGSMSSGLQQALDCMLVVLKCVNDSMHQIAITGVPVDLSQQGELLLQSSFLVVSENKRDLRLRIRPRRRHIFLYEKAMLFCKSATKNSHNKATYHFKHDLQMSQIGLTESVKGDLRKFEVWRQGRAEVHTITAPTADIKRVWVERIKRVLLDQLNELKGERVRQYGAQHRTLIQASSWELGAGAAARPGAAPARAASCDAHDEPCWSTDPSDDDDDEPEHAPAVGCALVALSDYTAVGASEVSLREGQHADLLKVGCAGWWYVRLAGGQGEGWAPAAYLDQRKTSRSSSRSHDRLHDH
ncbi:guanine nucleotide exchange factor DBS-like isoform X6 [Vanessa tameamea]|uniref:Guanine nucleotide exchange factor DBS-like isoform X6 n=1 Tax=Vanessa tameamea TaxID=334116 RepID=A0ABM4AVP7_VANTA